MNQLNINPEMDELAAKHGLGHWSCVSVKSNQMWLRSDGRDFYYTAKAGSVIIELRLFDEWIAIGKDWQQPETEDEFLNRKLPCDIKIGSSVNKAGTSIRTLVMRAHNVAMCLKIATDQQRYANANKQSTLVQKPFKYPCDGALYFTKSHKHQVKITGFLYSDDKKIIGLIDGVSNNSFWCAETGKAVNQFGDTAISNDLIMFTWSRL